MIVSHIDQVAAQKLMQADLKDVAKQVLIGPKQGWRDHIMRLFTVAPGGYTPRHIHDWPHINYVTQGSGVIYLEGKEHPLSPGSFAYVPAGAEHQFRNTGSAALSLICIIPAPVK